MTNLKSLYYEDKEMRDIMKKYYQIKRNLLISILFLIQHNCILSPLVVYKKAYDISRKGSHFVPHHKIQIPGCKYSLNYLNINVYSFNYLNITM